MTKSNNKKNNHKIILRFLSHKVDISQLNIHILRDIVHSKSYLFRFMLIKNTALVIIISRSVVWFLMTFVHIYSDGVLICRAEICYIVGKQYFLIIIIIMIKCCVCFYLVKRSVLYVMYKCNEIFYYIQLSLFIQKNIVEFMSFLFFCCCKQIDWNLLIEQ